MRSEIIDTPESTAAEEHGHALKTGDRLLHGQYTIQCYLSSGGFGVTYLARDSLDRKVVIKECFPASICLRKDKAVVGRTPNDHSDFKKIVRALMHEARRMAKLDHPNIVGVHQVFEDNGTAYMALDFVKGRDLLEIIEHDPKRLTPDLVKNLLLKILDAIDYIHTRNILHRDISPDNILITDSDEPVLIDFGAAREVSTRESRALSAINVVKDGYSPHEFYSSVAQHTPSSDLYSLAATFYHAITGDPPPDSQTRLSAMVADEIDPLAPIPVRTEGYDHYFLGAIEKALALFPKDRLQSARRWVEEIDAEKRQAALLAEASKDEQVEQLIKQITTETNEALEAAETEARVEEELLAIQAQQEDQDTSGAPADTVLLNEKWGDLLDDAPDRDIADLAKARNKKSLIGRIIASPLSLFSGDKQVDVGRMAQ